MGVAAVAGLHWPEVQAWVASSGAWGEAAFGGAFVLLTVGCFPVSLLGVTAGMLYGPWRGLALVYGAAYLSGVIMFGLGRSALAPWVERLVARNRRLRGLGADASGKALRLNILARLSPFNYGLVCYTLAAGRTRWPVYLLGLLAAVPSMAAQVWVGHFIAQARAGAASSEQAANVKTAGAVVGAVALLVLIWQTGRLVRSAWGAGTPVGRGKPHGTGAEAAEDHERP